MGQAHEDAAEALWRDIDKTKTGMLQAGAHGQAQPMTAFADREAGALYFFSKTDTDLVQAVDGDTDAQFIFISKDQTLHASARGVISIDHDRARIDQYWGPMVAAWYPNGKTDPELVLLRMDLEEASVWLSTGNPIKMMWEVARANSERREPDIGTHEEIKVN